MPSMKPRRTARAEPVEPDVNWIREVEVEALMSLQFARILRNWLDERIRIMEDPDRDVITVIGDDRAEATGNDNPDTTATGC